MASLQAQLSQERSSRHQLSDLNQELEVKIQTLGSELERGIAREEKLSDDNRLQVERISLLEKETASLGLELKAAQGRYNEEVKAHQETERSRLLNKEEANLEVVKGKFVADLYFFIVGFNEEKTN